MKPEQILLGSGGRAALLGERGTLFVNWTPAQDGGQARLLARALGARGVHHDPEMLAVGWGRGGESPVEEEGADGGA